MLEKEIVTYIIYVRSCAKCRTVEIHLFIITIVHNICPQVAMTVNSLLQKDKIRGRVTYPNIVQKLVYR